MHNLEFTKYNYDFAWMQYENALYSTKEYFPAGVTFKELQDHKDEMFLAYPESSKTGIRRGISLIEKLNKAIEKESQNNTKKICYLIISHGRFVDELAYAFDILKTNPEVPATAFLGLSENQRTLVEKFLFTYPYNSPAYCSISGFKVESKGMDPLFSRHSDHIKDLLTSYVVQSNVETGARSITKVDKKGAGQKLPVEYTKNERGILKKIVADGPAPEEAPKASTTQEPQP